MFIFKVLRFLFISVVTLYLATITLTYSMGKIEASKSDGNLKFMPMNYSKTLNHINSRLLESQNFTPVELEQNALSILKQAPLNDKAVFHLALARKLETDSIANKGLLKLVLSRNPRNRRAHQVIISQNISEKNYHEAADHIISMLRLQREVKPLYLNPLVTLYIEDIARDVIEVELMKHPYWGKSFFIFLINNSPKSELHNYLELIRKFKKNAPDHEIHIILSTYISLLYANNQKDIAYQVWQESNRSVENDITTSNINRMNLKKPPFDTKFSWQLRNNTVVSTKFDPGGIHVYSNGKSASVALSKVFLLPKAGPLDFTYKADHNPKINSSFFEWRFSCTDTGKILATYKLSKSTISGSPIRKKVNHLETPCNFIKLELVSQPGHYPKNIETYLSYVNITSMPK